MLPTVPPPPLCPSCGDYPPADLAEECALCVLREVNDVPREARPTARPATGACGRQHITGWPCPTCAAPQWVDWPTHPGWWWMYYADFGIVPVEHLVDADDDGGIFLGREYFSRDTFDGPVRFLDARLTPPAAPGAP